MISEIIKIKRKLVDERIRASRNEDELLEEIVALEEQIKENIALQNEKQDEIDVLKEKIKFFERERRKESKQKTKAYNIIRKRFKTLYKNILVNQSLSRLVNLNHEVAAILFTPLKNIFFDKSTNPNIILYQDYLYILLY